VVIKAFAWEMSACRSANALITAEKDVVIKAFV